MLNLTTFQSQFGKAGLLGSKVSKVRIWGHNWIVDRARETTLFVSTNTLFEGCNGPFREEVASAVFAEQ